MAGEHLLVVNVCLYPSHEMLYVFGCRHLRRTLEVLVILP